MSEIAVYERPLSIEEIKRDINTIQHVLREVMQKDVHYGLVPGCGNKPALFKPGAEKIAATFKLAACPRVEDLSTHDEKRYRVLCDCMAPNGRLVGTGVGEASTDELKYRWRAAVCQAEFDTTPEDRRRMKYDRDGTCQGQVRTNPADMANTVLKMAKKRALVDMVLTCTAASDIFTQDIEEDGDGAEAAKAKAGIKRPERKATTTVKADLPLVSLADLSGAPIGDTYHVQVLLKTVKEEKTKTGKEITRMTVSQIIDDGSEMVIPCSAWGLHPKTCIVGKQIDCTLQVGEYQGAPQYTANNMSLVNPEPAK